MPHSQGAPSTIRCIKTDEDDLLFESELSVREHPAPSGALRPLGSDSPGFAVTGQGAPSTTRCIKTSPARVSGR